MSAAASPSSRRAARPPDAKAVDEALLLLARSVQQFHTYPPGSPICQQAVDACVKALVSLDSRDTVSFRVAPNAIVVDEEPVGTGTLIEQEIARRLHQASIAEVTIERAVSARELARFCSDLVACGDRSAPRAALIDLMTEHGVKRIALRAAYRPEVLAVPAVGEPVQELIGRERARRDELLSVGGPVNHLYPPDKGWVRVDPSTPLGTVSLIDLTLLAENPTVLAGMLVRLTDGDAGGGGEEEALSRKYSEVATLFGALDPRLARVMFAKLARAVLDLDSDRRQTLLKKTILPGLLDGRLDGAVLKDFPDLELADSLCLLLDLEAAAPEVVTAALTRLELPAERQAAMLPLLEHRVQTKVGGAPPDNAVDSHARRLVRIDRERAKSVAEFAAFDLAIDEETRCAPHAADTNDRSVGFNRRAARLPVEPDAARAQPGGGRSLRGAHPHAGRGIRAKQRLAIVHALDCASSRSGRDARGKPAGRRGGVAWSRRRALHPGPRHASGRIGGA